MSLKTALARIKSIPGLQKRFNIFISVNHGAERQLQDSSPELALSNLVAGVKDNIVMKGLPTTCGSRMLVDYESPYDASCVQELRDAGVVIAGKTNLDEFGMGSGGVHSYFGPVLNPMYPNSKVVAGGSSSGSAAAVAAGAVDFALGTDTGGSVRLPASYCAVLGFKPSYGRISRFGVVAYAQSLDTVGIIAKDISIIRRVFKVIDKYDPKDPTSLGVGYRKKASAIFRKRDKLRIGVPQEFLQQSICDQYKDLFQQFIEKLMRIGHEIYPVSIPSIKDSLPIYYTLSPAEAVSNLSRFDGVRYGTRNDISDIENGVLFAPTRNNFGREVQDRIILGNYNLCSETFKNNYVKAQKLRLQMMNQFDEIFRDSNILSNFKGNESGVDLIIGLTATSTPPTINSFLKAESSSPTNEYLNDVFTMPMSLAGLPTLSMPIAKEIPLGVQIAAQYANDNAVLEFADGILR
ncbi:hypothetical protein HG537_0A00530 [Torulaspora globosa]|uniref:Glutamyl-tRNA(Gln) amidotransferase subunit A, mitochondrial n=1 Tax=Torulaspora globosa TaxID=48254 RepID=A0A7H9HJX9_9SACH|nr:hypothetical protein HG537_0A00530 [Torulaspora sp. CBS 2947]